MCEEKAEKHFIEHFKTVKVKVSFALEQAVKVQSGSRGVTLLFL
jgi:hypothetical protein